MVKFISGVNGTYIQVSNWVININNFHMNSKCAFKKKQRKEKEISLLEVTSFHWQ